ncbi:MAG: phospho-N-acetylmuramoyl-pentapeptide-transferase [Blastochloris viridis]|uniref:Phospho-N-acetylmuramoyl-pentapeptide-transferase n=1 Tax=Blastochloris viridis TaxID=1079 RepID=A0A6N4QZB1_BLAVI|nr:MAG: phospho-N-acetylmuramoyl-pentapeptide-transferase [Blastochloris viridis]
MIPALLLPFVDYVNWFNVFQYLTVRAGAAMFTAFLLWLVFGTRLITAFRLWQKGGDTVKAILPHQGKAGTPSMGGIGVVGAMTLATLLWANLANGYVWLLLFLLVGYGAIGFMDDYLNLTRRWKKGLPGKLRLALGTFISTVFLLGYVYVNGTAVSTEIYFPFIKELVVGIGIWGFVMFGVLVMVGTANAVNLTDGLDGLVSIPVVLVATTMAILAYVMGRVDYTAYLHLPHIAGSGEISIMCAALAGATLGFLWYNAPPARIFLGDSGSLPVGAFLGGVAVMIKQEFALLIIGGLFVVETLSVMIQVAGYKLTRKRIFRMAPLHHHFEQLGWPESTIVIRFWICSVILALIGLATLKLR